MKEKLIIKVLGKAMDFLTQDQARQLRSILEEEFYYYDIHPASNALIVTNGISDKVMMYIASKNLDGLSDNTLITYRRTLLKFSACIQKDLESITTMDIRMYLAVHAKQGLKTSSMATLISVLKSFFTWLENEEYLQKSPMRKIKTTKTDKYIRKALTPIELEMIRVASKTVREKALIEFFYSTGCRLDEVQKLNKIDIDWPNSKIVVLGKGKKEREVYLNAKAKVHLWKYLNSRKDDNESLFVGERQPHERLGRRAIQKTFNELGKLAGITKKVYPHLFRHTTATIMLNTGASLAEVQKYLGHGSPVTTQIYAQLDTDALQQSHKKHVV